VDGVEHASYLVRLTDGARPVGLAGLPDIRVTDKQLAGLATSGIAVCPTTGGSFLSPPPHVKMVADAGITTSR
jgi:hypothetical protein